MSGHRGEIVDLARPRMVRQEHPNGCGIACIAMVTGLGYAQVRDTLSEFLPRERDYGEEGIHHGITEWFLGRLGYAWRTVYAGHQHDPWPPEPFAPVHIAQVRQPSGNTHYVVLTDDGIVFDPLDGERKSLAEWDVPDGKFSGVNNVMGIWRIEAPCAHTVWRVSRREGWVRCAACGHEQLSVSGRHSAEQAP